MCSQTRNSCAKAFDNRSRSKNLKPKKSRRGVNLTPPPPPPPPSRLLGLSWKYNTFKIAYRKIVRYISARIRDLELLNPHVRINPSHFSRPSINDCFGLVLLEEQLHSVLQSYVVGVIEPKTHWILITHQNWGTFCSFKVALVDNVCVEIIDRKLGNAFHTTEPGFELNEISSAVICFLWNSKSIVVG